MGVKRVDVTSAREMQSAVMDEINKQHIFIASAAVADYRAADIADEKIKKQDDDDNVTCSSLKIRYRRGRCRINAGPAFCGWICG